MMVPFDYRDESSWIQSAPGSWEVLVAPATTPTAGEPDPRAAALATLTLTIGADIATTVVIMDKPGGGIQLSVLPPT
jgi:hypothetical protein